METPGATDDESLDTRALRKSSPASDPTSWARETFVDECERTRGLLAGCCHTVAFLEGSELLTYLHSCISGKRHQVRVPTPACYLNSYLSKDVDIHVGLNEVVLGPVEDPEAVIACISPVAQQGQPAYPGATYPGILTVLNGLPFEWRSTQRYLPLAREKAAAELRKYVRAHASARKGGVTRLRRTPQKRECDIERVAEERAQEASAAQAMVEHGKRRLASRSPSSWDSGLRSAGPQGPTGAGDAQHRAVL